MQDFLAIRYKEDPWNSIGSGAITVAVLAARRGFSICCDISNESVGIAMNHAAAEQFKPCDALDPAAIQTYNVIVT